MRSASNSTASILNLIKLFFAVKEFQRWDSAFQGNKNSQIGGFFQVARSRNRVACIGNWSSNVPPALLRITADEKLTLDSRKKNHQLSLSSKHLPKTSGDKAYGVCSINIKNSTLWGNLARGTECCWRPSFLSPMCFTRYGNQVLLFMKLCLKMSFSLRYWAHLPALLLLRISGCWCFQTMIYKIASLELIE